MTAKTNQSTQRPGTANANPTAVAITVVADERPLGTCIRCNNQRATCLVYSAVAMITKQQVTTGLKRSAGEIEGAGQATRDDFIQGRQKIGVIEEIFFGVAVAPER